MLLDDGADGAPAEAGAPMLEAEALKATEASPEYVKSFIRLHSFS